MLDPIVNVLGPNASEREAYAEALAAGGYACADYSDLVGAQRSMRAYPGPQVWLVRFDAEGEGLLRWARTHAPSVRFVVIVGQVRGEDVHRAYELGARYCVSADKDEVLRAIEFAVEGFDMANSQRRLRPFGARSSRLLTADGLLPITKTA